MAIPKTWTAADVKMGSLGILDQDGVLHVERRYMFVDDTDALLTQIAGGRLVRDVEWSSIPSSVQAALLTIDDWCYNQILDQEGMA